MSTESDMRRRFAAKYSVDHETGCWLWPSLTSHGYGRFYFQSRVLMAHRASYELNVGPIPDGMVIDHLCRNKACVNPDHLEAVAQGENVRRGLRGHLKARCAKGHEYAGENVYVAPATGWRSCRTCNRISKRKEVAA